MGESYINTAARELPRGRGREVPTKAEELTRARLVEARGAGEPGRAHGVEQAQRPEEVNVGRVLAQLEGDLDVALRAQVVDLVRPHGRDDLVARARVAEVAEDEPQARRGLVAVDEQVLDSARVECRGPPHEANDEVALCMCGDRVKGGLGSVSGCGRERRWAQYTAQVHAFVSSSSAR